MVETRPPEVSTERMPSESPDPLVLFSSERVPAPNGTLAFCAPAGTGRHADDYRRLRSQMRVHLWTKY